MILIVGLGNPGKKFQRTRHNLGFRVLDQFAKREKFSKFQLFKNLKSLISGGKINEKEVILVKPQTFMNSSGKTVKKIVKTYTLVPKNLIIIHDDIDLSLGKIRISIGRGAAGHKGVQSIIDELKTKGFVRFRIGIKPRSYKLEAKNLAKFVLQKFNKKEEKILKEIIKKTCQAIEVALKDYNPPTTLPPEGRAPGIEKAMQKFNK